MKPLQNFLLLKVEPERRTASGIVLSSGKPDPQAVALERGTVLALGPGSRNVTGIAIPPACLVDDVVLFNRNGAVALPELPGQVLVAEPFVMAIVDGPSLMPLTTAECTCEGPMVSFHDGTRKVHEWGCPATTSG